jgi:tRNA modification GTPase
MTLTAPGPAAMTPSDTIAAISSSVGPAARMIVRLSGPAAIDLAGRLVPGLQVAAASAQRRTMSIRGMNLPAWCYVFIAPHSYTGQDLVELHIPGSPLLARTVLDDLFRLGARSAEPGEFTARAYYSGRIDLTQAEGVAATISAMNQAELSAARRLASGELAQHLRPSMDLLAETLALIEVAIDFSDEDVTFLSARQVAERIGRIEAELGELIAGSARFERLSHEPRIVLCGRPNAGKSTLLNALAGYERAIVSPIAGTTRDVIWADVRLRRGIVRVIDAAGIDESSPGGSLEQAMHKRAVTAIEQADVVVALRELADDRPLPDLGRVPDLVVRTKLDLALDLHGGDEIAVSALTGAGLDRLIEALDQLAFGQAGGEPSLALNARHVAAIGEARAALARAAGDASHSAELLAFELRQALDALGRIGGEVSPDDVLGLVFSRFCIGK